LALIDVLRTSRDMKKDCGKQGCPNDNRTQVLARDDEVIERAATSARGPKLPCSRASAMERALDAVATSPTPVRWLVVAAEPVTSVDVTACDVVAQLDETLHAQGIELCFAELKDPVKDKLKRFGLFAQLGENYFFPTIGVAVSRYLEINNVEWEDWEDRAAVKMPV
jgi:hypothetical protein